MKQLKITKQITKRESESLDKYLREIGHYNLITADEEVLLAQQIHCGDQIALEKLVNANLRFVVSVAKQYQNKGLNLGDLINEGNLGLVKAATRFDETRGFKFISYAVWWIRQAIIQALAEQGRIVRLPLNRVSSISKISKKFSELEQTFQRDPTEEELAHALEIPNEEVSTNMRISSRQMSIDAPFSMNEVNSLLDVLEDGESASPDSELLIESLRKEIMLAISILPIREADIICFYYGLNGNKTHTLEEIGNLFNITRERVRQLKEKATIKLRRGVRSPILKTYLGAEY